MKRSCVPSIVRVCSGLFTAATLACAADLELGELASSTGETDVSVTDDPGHESVGEHGSSSSAGDGGPIDCMGGGPWPCSSDPDGDDVPFPCDNAEDRFNPSQSDVDGDGIGDVIDLCPTLAGSNNSADSDQDGIGNDCDVCRATAETYNVGADELGLPTSYRVRSIPDVGDVDGDGVGDACDNCVAVANCLAWNGEDPWQLGDPNAEGAGCQADADADLVGDACEGMQLAGAAGVVGFADDDDFDQDGLTNLIDGCSRLPLAAIACENDDACPTGASCELAIGICNHPDADDDTVGDACDTCPFTPNAEQVVDGAQQADDGDGDFIGNVCEAGGSEIFNDPRPMDFYTRAASGLCCTVQLLEDDGAITTAPSLVSAGSSLPLLDPDGIPVRLECSAADQAADICVKLPDAVAAAPGMLELPAVCDGIAGEALDYNDYASDERWAYRCELPPLDQDFDGIGDVADLCPFAFDPTNEPYIDANGVVWPKDGKYCNGEYSLDALCEE
jgi:thrombospondin type 3 repeat protein